MIKGRERIGDLLVDRGVITGDQLAEALATQQRGQQEKLLGEILIDAGMATEEQVLAAVASGCGVPFAHLTPQMPDPEVRAALPEAFLQKHGVLPLFKVRNVLTVAVSEPANVFVVDEIAQAAGTSVQVVAATADNIYAMIEQTRTDEGLAPSPTSPDAAPAELFAGEEYSGGYDSFSGEQLAGAIVREAVRAGADTVHLEPEEKVLRVRFRIHGTLHVVMRPPIRTTVPLTDALEEMIGIGPDAGGIERSGSARLKFQGEPVQLSLRTMDGAFGPRTLMSLMRDKQAHASLDKLGADFDLMQRYKRLVEPLRGVLVVTGPRDCGATTTLYSTLHHLDPVRLNVCTFESQIAYSLSGINQFSPATCGSEETATVLATLRRQQPDVILLDAPVDSEAVAQVLEAVADGCFVLLRMRGRDAVAAARQFAEWTPPRDGVGSLIGVLGQRLLRTVCPNCRVRHETAADLRRSVAEVFGEVNHHVRGRGCPTCRHTGFSGRIGVFEFLEVDNGVRQALADEPGVSDPALDKALGPTLWTDGINKVRAGITSLDEVMDVLAGCRGFTPPSQADEPAAGPHRRRKREPAERLPQ